MCPDIAVTVAISVKTESSDDFVFDRMTDDSMPNSELFLWRKEQLRLRSLVNPWWICEVDDVISTWSVVGLMVGELRAGPVGNGLYFIDYVMFCVII